MKKTKGDRMGRWKIMQRKGEKQGGGEGGRKERSNHKKESRKGERSN